MAKEYTYSKSTVHAAFSGTDLPTLEVVRELAHCLAGLADRDPEEQVPRFHELWVSAAQEDAVVGGGEGRPLKPTSGSGLSEAQEPHLADFSATLLPQRESLPTASGEPAAHPERGDPWCGDWLVVVEWALSAVFLSLFPKKSTAYRFLSEASVPSEHYIVGDPSTIGYWASIVEYVRGKSSVEGLERLINLAAKKSEGGEQRLRTLVQALRATVRE
ncbi:hypothetical protein [Streptomyces sp. NBC_00847]|uniref:hypothetical protein n=1 Tax=Streptomyces sp. NBC_00847 TaxID=2975850 RepID=UPI00225092C9|nr:hypothetical protein [Streptomyces sp. NBC_00847]MCX4881633.1 hypothetical protein [Streptomyces sp. NBC_00847]